MIDAYNRERDLHINQASFFDVHASRQSLHLFLFLFFLEVSSFSGYFCTIIPVFSLYCMENTSHVSPFWMVLSTL